MTSVQRAGLSQAALDYYLSTPATTLQSFLRGEPGVGPTQSGRATGTPAASAPEAQADAGLVTPGIDLGVPAAAPATTEPRVLDFGVDLTNMQPTQRPANSTVMTAEQASRQQPLGFVTGAEPMPQAQPRQPDRLSNVVDQALGPISTLINYSPTIAPGVKKAVNVAVAGYSTYAALKGGGGALGAAQPVLSLVGALGGRDVQKVTNGLGTALSAGKDISTLASSGIGTAAGLASVAGLAGTAIQLTMGNSQAGKVASLVASGVAAAAVPGPGTALALFMQMTSLASSLGSQAIPLLSGATIAKGGQIGDAVFWTGKENVHYTVTQGQESLPLDRIAVSVNAKTGADGKRTYGLKAVVDYSPINPGTEGASVRLGKKGRVDGSNTKTVGIDITEREYTALKAKLGGKDEGVFSGKKAEQMRPFLGTALSNPMFKDSDAGHGTFQYVDVNLDGRLDLVQSNTPVVMGKKTLREGDDSVVVKLLDAAGKTTGTIKAASMADAQTKAMAPTVLAFLASHPNVAKRVGKDMEKGLDVMLKAAARMEQAQAKVKPGKDGAPSTAPAQKPLITFDAMEYLASNTDVAQKLQARGLKGDALAVAATKHYLNEGKGQGRATNSFDPMQYLASNLPVFDQLNAKYGNDANLVASKAAQHYVEHGAKQGLLADDFDEQALFEANPEFAAAYGTDPSTAAAAFLADYSQQALAAKYEAQAVVQGTDDADVAQGSEFNDLAALFGGDDQFNAGAGHDQVFGGLGNDTLAGGIGDDSLAGEEGNDRLHGGAGQDQLSGDAGNDRLGGGTGNDSLFGGIGNDRLTGGAGADGLAGEAGKDRLNGGGGNDAIDGGLGADHLVGASGADQLSGGRGGDTLAGGAGADKLHGGNGRDTLTAGEGNDRIAGGKGRDTAVYAGKRSDYVITQLGANRFEVRDSTRVGGDGKDIVTGVELLKFADGKVNLKHFDAASNPAPAAAKEPKRPMHQRAG